MPQTAHKRVDVSLLEHSLHYLDDWRFGIGPVPFLKDLMRDLTLPCGARRRVQRVERLQLHDLAREKLVRITAQPIERSRRNIDQPLIRIRHWTRPRIYGRFGRADHGPGQIDGACVRMFRQQIAKQRLNAQKKPRRYRRPTFIPRRTAEHDFRSTKRTGEIVRRKADTEIRTGNTQCPQYRRRQKRVDAATPRPYTFVKTCADYDIRTVHARFEQSEHLYPRMTAIRRANGHRLHCIHQHASDVARTNFELRLPGVETKILDELR